MNKCKYCGNKLAFIESVIPPIRMCFCCISAKERVKEEERTKEEKEIKEECDKREKLIIQRKKYFR